MVSWRWLSVLVVALLPGFSAAAESCTQIRIRYSGGGTDGVSPDSKIHEDGNWRFSHAEACSSLASRMQGLVISGITLGTVTLTPVMSSGAYRCEGSALRPGLSDQVFSAGNFAGESRAAECPPGPCDGVAGMETTRFGPGAFGVTCQSGCALTPRLPAMRICAGGDCPDESSNSRIARYTYSGGECPVEDVDESVAADCVLQGGQRVCAEVDDDGLVAAVDQDFFRPLAMQGCVSFESGGVACVVEFEGEATGVAVPDDGNSESPAPAVPTVSVVEGDTTVNYYGPTIVAGSITPVSTGSGTGSQPGADGEGGGSAGSICSGDDCYGDLPASFGGCAEDLAACAAAVGASAWTTVTEGIPLIGFIAGLHSAFGTAGTCPVTELTLLGQTYDFMGPACSLVDQHAALLALVFQIFWSLVGLRIILESE